MLTFNEFKSTHKLLDVEVKGKLELRHVFAVFWFTVEDIDDQNKTVFNVCGEEYNSIDEAAVRLYQMYCDEESLTGD